MNESYREAVSGFTHLLGAVLALMGAAWLIHLTSSEPHKLIIMGIYGASMVLAYLASTAMHLFNSYIGDKHYAARWLQRIDHASIFVMIAGGYTPFTYLLLQGEQRWLVMGFVWIVAFCGVILKLFFFFSGYLSTFFYLGMGWMGIFVAPEAFHLLNSHALGLIGAGGVIYSVGAIIYSLGRPNLHHYFGSHELWHLFVMAGTTCHFVAVVNYLI